MVRDGACAPPHHEGLALCHLREPHPEERACARLEGWAAPRLPEQASYMHMRFALPPILVVLRQGLQLGRLPVDDLEDDIARLQLAVRQEGGIAEQRPLDGLAADRLRNGLAIERLGRLHRMRPDL